MTFNRRHFLSTLTAAAGLSVLPAGAQGAAPSWRRSFSTAPQQTARPWVRWWWPGGVVSDDELRREIKVLKLAGFGGAEIQAFNPGIPGLTKDERTRLHDYANPAFFSHVEAAAAEALRNGMQIDYTFGSAWPLGGGFAVTPELALIELTPALTSVTAPLSKPIRLEVPANTKKFGALSVLDARTKDPRASRWAERLAARSKLVAVVAFKGSAPVLDKNKGYRSAVVKETGNVAEPGVVVTGLLRPDGTLDWTPPSAGDWQIVVFKQYAVDSSVMAGVGEGPQLVMDHFNKHAFAAHASRVGAPLAKLGPARAAIRATFVDSLELMADIYWSDDLLAQFERRRGYDLTPHLPYLMQRGWMEAWNAHAALPYFASAAIGDRVRADYRLTLSDLMIENLWEPFAAWNHAHGLQARVQAHGGPADLLRSYGLADIVETEDLESGGNVHFLRMARAAADLYGRRIVSCESLCWNAASFETTPAQWFARVNRLFTSGVNEIVMHGFPYALHADAWPGWYPFAPSGFLAGFSSMLNEANPLWAAIPTLNAYIARIQALLQTGRNVVPVCVFYGEIGHFHGIEPAPAEDMLQALLDGGYDYDRINDHAISQSHIENGVLVTPGGARFAALVVPKRDGLRASTASQLAAFAKARLPLIFLDALPSREEGYKDHEAADRRVRESMQAALAGGAQLSPVAKVVASLQQAGVAPNLTFTSEPCSFIEKSVDGEVLYLLHNPKAEPARVSFLTRATGYPERWNAFDGSRSPLPGKKVGKQTEVNVEIDAGGAALIAFSALRPRQPALPSVVVESLSLGGQRWKLAAAGHGFKGRKVDQEIELASLRDWAGLEGLSDFSGQGKYSTTFELGAAWLNGQREVLLDLGTVHDMALVTVNGKPIGTLIAPPYQLEIGKALVAGANVLAITVVNSPNNAMINPKLPGLKNLTVKPAGLLGPVRLQLKNRKKTT